VDDTTKSVDDTTKNGAAVGEAKGDDGRLEVKDDQRKLGWWAECTIESNC
jgi:hypothetical protein